MAKIRFRSWSQIIRTRPDQIYFVPRGPFVETYYGPAVLMFQACRARGAWTGYCAEGHVLIDASNYSFARFTALPEPGTLALFCLGLVGLGFTRRRKA